MWVKGLQVLPVGVGQALFQVSFQVVGLQVLLQGESFAVGYREHVVSQMPAAQLDLKNGFDVGFGPLCLTSIQIQNRFVLSKTFIPKF